MPDAPRRTYYRQDKSVSLAEAPDRRDLCKSLERLVKITECRVPVLKLVIDLDISWILKSVDGAVMKAVEDYLSETALAKGPVDGVVGW